MRVFVYLCREKRNMNLYRLFMTNWKRTACILAAVALLTASCSDKGVRMPRHRKKVHCDCPTFSELTIKKTERLG